MTPKLKEAASKCPLVDILLQWGETAETILLLLVDMKTQLKQDLDKLKFTETACVTMLDGQRMFWVPEKDLLAVARSLWGLPYHDPVVGD